MQDDLRSEIISVLARRASTNFAEITDSTRIREDLSLDGDDGVDTIIEISRIFKLDTSKFDAARYFNPEPTLFSIFDYIFRRKTARSPLTVGDLVAGAERGSIE